jgi:hypothetical protein
MKISDAWRMSLQCMISGVVTATRLKNGLNLKFVRQPSVRALPFDARALG